MNHQERAEALEREIAEWREENAAQASEIVRLAAALERASAEQSERAMQAIDVFGACLLANAHDLAIVQHNARVLRRRMKGTLAPNGAGVFVHRVAGEWLDKDDERVTVTFDAGDLNSSIAKRAMELLKGGPSTLGDLARALNGK